MLVSPPAETAGGSAIRTPRRAGQFRLLRERRFLPYFLAQALAALNDNLLRTLVVLAATYQASVYRVHNPALLANLVGGLFILPFVLFSGIGGQLADRFDKALVLKTVRAAELLVVALAVTALLGQRLPLLLSSLFLMGVCASLFAPAKYGLLPQVLARAELVGGNALVETGTFVAILLGTLAAGVLAIRGDARLWSVTLVVLAAAGLAVSLLIPRLTAASPQLAIDCNPYRASRDNLREALASRPVFLAVLGVSWFWFYGALLLAQLPLLSRFVLHGAEPVLTLLLTVFTVAVGTGALGCEWLSGRRLEIGLVPFGSIGLTLFALDLAWASSAAPADAVEGVRQFFALPHAWRMLVDLAGLGVFGGMYVVPLYALMQQRAPRDALARVMGANSIVNAAFMVVAAVFGALVLKAGASVPVLLVLAALLNALVAAYIYSLLPEFLLRFLSWLLVRTVYRMVEEGRSNIPEHGAALLVCNHVSFVDALVISAACERPIRFVMESAIFEAPVINVLARGMKAVPIAARRENPQVYERAFAIVADELQHGQLVCIFPEGRLTRDGGVAEFRPGVMRILAETPVPVVPMALSGLWGSVFSRHPGRWWAPLVRSPAARIAIRIGAPLPAAQATPELLRERVLALREAP